MTALSLTTVDDGLFLRVSGLCVMRRSLGGMLQMSDIFAVATVKAIPTLLAALITLGLGWLLGNGIASLWEEVKKRRALELDALGRFYELYGEFYAVWKLWSIYKKKSEYPSIERDPKAVWGLLERAAKVEGGFESLLIRLTQERRLEPADIDQLARFREAYQSLRESIRVDETLHWRADPTQGEPAQRYEQFKRLASHLASLLSQSDKRIIRRPALPSPSEAADRMVSVTRVEHRGEWWVESAKSSTVIPSNRAGIREVDTESRAARSSSSTP
jgi:hypothetical protein